MRKASKSVCGLIATIMGSSISGAVLDPYSSVGFFKQGTAFPDRVKLHEVFGPGAVSDSYSGSDVYASYFGSGIATVGRLGVSASIRKGIVPLNFYETFSSEAFFADNLTVRATSPTEVSANYRFAPTIHLSGSAHWFPPRDIAPVETLIVQWTKLEDSDWIIHDVIPFVPTNGRSVDEIIKLPFVSVPAGLAFNYTLQFWVTTTIDEGSRLGFGISSAEGDFRNTLTVTGIDVQNASGDSIDFTITAGSGARYTAGGIEPVPEPGSIGSVLSGLAVVAVLLYCQWRQRVKSSTFV